VAAVAALDLATAEEASDSSGRLRKNWRRWSYDAAVKKDAPLFHEEKGQ